MEDDTVCTEHFLVYEGCKFGGDYFHCKQCREALVDGEYEAFRSDHCGLCNNYCAELRHHRKYSLAFDYFFECSMQCGFMDYNSTGLVFVPPTVQQFEDCTTE